MTKKVKTPIRYYGGKQNLLQYLIPVFDSDNSETFVSLFTGGGALEFYKKPHKSEIWNDTLNSVVNFYEVLKTPELCKMLIAELDKIIYAESLYNKMRIIYNQFAEAEPGNTHDKIMFAVAFFCNANMSFASKLNAGFGYGNLSRSLCSQLNNKKVRLLKCGDRIKNILIMNRDAVECFKMFNKENTIFYADPPYYQANMGHYGGYTRENFENLLKALESCKHKFVLSSYDCDLLQDYILKNSWYNKKIKMSLYAGKAIDNENNKRNHKFEMITTNFNINHNLNLF